MLARCWPDEPTVQWVHATSAGVDALMFPALTESGIPVTNARGVFDRGIAEYVLGAVLLFAKDTLGNLRFQRQHRWVHRDTALIRDQRVLVVGAGSIGTTVGRLLSSVGMRVTGIARTAREVEGFEAVHAQDRLAACLAESDHVVITAPLTRETEGLFDRSMLEAMKSGASLTNVGRGPIVRTDDLVTVLESGHLGGAALDVFEEEPLPEGHPLWDRPDVMVSAHMAGDFIGWRRALGEQFVENFQRWQARRELSNRVQ
jgi:phosphoglycerate dehydrogenase-like enzyme